METDRLMDGTTKDLESPDYEAALDPNDGASVRGDFVAPFAQDRNGDPRSLVYGEVIEAIVLREDDEELIVDLGLAIDGVVPYGEYSLLDATARTGLEAGATVPVFVVNAGTSEGRVSVSIRRAQRAWRWWQLEQLFTADAIIEVRVTHANMGGLLVDLDGVTGFVPSSRLPGATDVERHDRLAVLSRFVGTMQPVKIIEFDRHRGHIVLSISDAVRLLRKRERRANRQLQAPTIESQGSERRDAFIRGLTIGETVQGRVSAVVDFGLFVDLGGAIGLVHTSELSWNRLLEPADLHQVGDEVTVAILSLSPEAGRIGLSIKRTQVAPWNQVADDYPVGKLVRATVTDVVKFGAFARIVDGIEGLIHVSELVDGERPESGQVMATGQAVILRVISLDPENFRMGLSLRSALNAPDSELLDAFGDGILQERDTLREQVRVALSESRSDAS